MSREVITRSFQPGDISSILGLFAKCFPHAARQVDHFRWKYESDPFGREHISLTFQDGALVGHYAGYPVPFYAAGVELLAHQVGDTMTDPAVRHIGRGPTSVLGRTARHFYETFCEGKVSFNYGFNVANIQRFSQRFLRSDRVEPVPYRHRDLAGRPLRRISRWGRWPRGYQLELVRETGPEFDHFFRKVAPSYRFLVRRDAAYLRWRYLQRPDLRYFLVAIRRWNRLVGWSVFRIRERSLLWGDALFDPRWPAAVAVLLRHVVPGYDVDAVEGWFPARIPWFDATLKQLEFESLPDPQDLSLMCVPFSLPEATGRMREELYYTMGDSDLF